MKHVKLLALTTALALTGCASPDYAQYAKAQADIAGSRATAESMRYSALATIAQNGDPTSRVAAVMALAMGQGSGGAAQTAIQAPPTSQALQWASILVPGLTSIAGMRYSYLGNKAASDNATALGMSTNDAFVGIAGQIQAPGAVTTLSGTGNLGSGSYTITDDHTRNSTPVVPPVIVPPVVVVPDTIVPPVVIAADPVLP